MHWPDNDSPFWGLATFTVFLVTAVIMLTFAKSWRDGDELRDLAVLLGGLGLTEWGRRRNGKKE